MLLTTALLNSMHGIARRRKFIQKRGKKDYYEYQLAFVAGRVNYSKRMLKADFAVHVWIFHGNSGRIHRMSATEQAQGDWEPVLESPGYEIGIQTRHREAAKTKRREAQEARDAKTEEQAKDRSLITLADGRKAKMVGGKLEVIP